jgi:arabinofuranan 3-O-arabinosyltransferase
VLTPSKQGRNDRASALALISITPKDKLAVRSSREGEALPDDRAGMTPPASDSRPIRAGTHERVPRLLGVFVRWRLLAYGYTLSVFYVASFVYLYTHGFWLLDRSGLPVYHDFTNMYVAGWEALHGHAASAYHAVEHLKAQERLMGTERTLFSIWPYPPPYFLILAPLAALPYLVAFFTFELGTLLGLVAVVHRIVRRTPAIALVLASPFTAWNFLMGQSGFLTATLIGSALLLLEHRPVLAGVFIGCLTYKPQFGILFPVALVASREWRAFVSTLATAALLAGVSGAAFGIGTWAALPQAFAAQAGVNLVPDTPSQLAKLQTVYGLISYLNGGVVIAGLTQSLATCGAGVLVWLAWRSNVRYALKAAALSAAALVATPYAFGYDLAAIAIPVAFLASDQLRFGLLRGEQTALLTLFAVSLSIIPAAGRSPVGALALLALYFLIIRRALHSSGERQQRISSSRASGQLSVEEQRVSRRPVDAVDGQQTMIGAP